MQITSSLSTSVQDSLDRYLQKYNPGTITVKNKRFKTTNPSKNISRCIVLSLSHLLSISSIRITDSVPTAYISWAPLQDLLFLSFIFLCCSYSYIGDSDVEWKGALIYNKENISNGDVCWCEFGTQFRQLGKWSVDNIHFENFDLYSSLDFSKLFRTSSKVILFCAIRKEQR